MTAPCNLCGFAQVETVRATPPPSSPLRIVRCSRCGLEFIDPFPTPTELQTLYAADYFCCPNALKGGYENYRADEPAIRKTFRRRWPLFSPWLGSQVQSRAVLDVGCATGAFLETMKERGWRTAGCDMSEYAVQAARDKGLDVLQGDIASYPGTGTFDLVTLWDVIEHVTDPIATLRACRARMNPDGLLVLSTPDASAGIARLLGKYWLGYRSAGEHVYFFGRQTITQALQASGFEVVSLSSVGKYLSLDRVIARLGYYTRLFRILLPFRGYFLSKCTLYLSSGDTMCVVARKV